MIWMSKKMRPKSSCHTFSYVFHLKNNLKIKIFSRDTNILPKIHWTSNIFGHSATIIRDFWVSLNYPLNFKKKVCLKNVWMQHWQVKISEKDTIDFSILKWFYPRPVNGKKAFLWQAKYFKAWWFCHCCSTFYKFVRNFSNWAKYWVKYR